MPWKNIGYKIALKIAKFEFLKTCMPRKQPIIIPQDACIGIAVNARAIAICKGGILSKYT